MYKRHALLLGRKTVEEIFKRHFIAIFRFFCAGAVIAYLLALDCYGSAVRRFGEGQHIII